MKTKRELGINRGSIIALVLGLLSSSCLYRPGPDALAGPGDPAGLYSHWYGGEPAFGPGPPGSPDELAVKDPSLVYYRGRWHLFYTCRNRDRYSVGYAFAPTIAGLERAPRHYLERLKGRSSYATAAPQVFFFAPQGRWYLVCQTMLGNGPGTAARYTPIYSTTVDIEDPASWSDPGILVDKFERSKWIDFWVICDQRAAYLFYTRNHQYMYYMTTALEDFPRGFGNPTRCQGVGRVHEASNLYKIAGQDQYLMLFELTQSGKRFFGCAWADDLAGPWKRSETLFASGQALVFSPGREPWTTMVSHGELIRAGFDHRLEIPSGQRIEFMIQGTNWIRPGYESTPWRLGVIRNFEDEKEGTIWQNENRPDR